MDTTNQVAWLSRWERVGLGIFLALLVAFGSLVELRSAFLQRRMTDLVCFLRAAWAVRTGNDFYEIKDDNDWHYNYPPLFAILMVPLADAPAGAARAGMVPYPITVAVWYVFSVACLVVGVHWLAGVLEEKWPDPRVRQQPRWCRRWWQLRFLPVLACLPPIGHTLMRGQVNLLLLALLCGLLAATLRNQGWRAGLFLAGAICLKVFPAFLILFPLWRRDLRCLAGCALGLFLGIGVIPAAVFGIPRTVAYYEKYCRVTLGPGIGAGSDQSRAKELIEMTANDSQSLQAALHNTLHPVRATRPVHPTTIVRWLPRFVGGLLTLTTLWAAGWRRSDAAPDVLLFLGALVINMLLLSPICHLHYFCMSVFLVTGLMAVAWENGQGLGLGTGLTALLILNFILNILPNIPGLEMLRDLALTMYPGLALWLAGVVVLWKRSRAAKSRPVEHSHLSSLAA